MTDKLFGKLWKDALAQPDKERYLAEYGYPEFFDEISSDLDTVMETLGEIHRAANMTLREIMQAAGMTQAAFARRFCIPLHTIEGWLRGDRKVKDYTRLSFCRELGILKIKTEEMENE